MGTSSGGSVVINSIKRLMTSGRVKLQENCVQLKVLYIDFLYNQNLLVNNVFLLSFTFLYDIVLIQKDFNFGILIKKEKYEILIYIGM